MRLFLLLLVLCIPAFAHAQNFPQLTGRIVDQANLINSSTETRLVGNLESLESRTTDQFVIVTVTSLQNYSIEDFARNLGNHWKIGQKNKDNGIILLIAPNEREVRIEVGDGLAQKISDSAAQKIIDNIILPKFKQNNMQDGIELATNEIIKILNGEVLPREETEPPSENNSIFGKIIFWLTIGVSAIIFIADPKVKVEKGEKKRFRGGGGKFKGKGASGKW
jgi:uncharacterized protein